MATIRKHRTKWQVQVRHKGSTALVRSFTHKADALEWAVEAERLVERRGLSTDPKLLERLKVADIVWRFERDTLPRRPGGKNEAIVLKAFLRHQIASTRLSEVSPINFATYRDDRLRVVKSSTLKRELGLIQHVFELAISEWGIPLATNPVKGVKIPKAPEARERRLLLGEWERLLEACRACRNRLLEPALRFAIETGLRRSELVNTRWRDLNWSDRTLRIPKTKNGYSRTIPLTFTALCVLASLGNIHQEDQPIFGITGEALKLAWARLTKRAGIADLHFHDLRHEAVSRFFELGLSLPEVALISGHRDPRMLFRYTHLRAEDVGKRISQLSKGLQNLGI